MGEKQEAMMDVAEKIYGFVSGLSLELRPEQRGQTAALCSQACLYVALMIVEAGYGKPPVDDDEATAIAKKMSDCHNELACKIGDYAKTYGAKVRSIGSDGSNQN